MSWAVADLTQLSEEAACLIAFNPKPAPYMYDLPNKLRVNTTPLQIQCRMSTPYLKGQGT